MLDVVPPGHEGGEEEKEERRPRKARMITPSVFSNPKKPPASESRVVQVEWKLPARLRKPIREQLRKERDARRRREAVIRFTRTPIHTRPIFKYDATVASDRRVQKPTRRVFNRGAEHHTGDTYRQTRPRLQMTPPPYGNMLPGKTPSARPSQPASKPGVTMRRAPRKSIQPPLRATAPRAKQPGLPNLFQERDVAYKWPGTQSKGNTTSSAGAFKSRLSTPSPKQPVPVQAEASPEIREPRRLSVPFTLNFWPKFLSASRQNDKGQPTSKKKVPKSILGGKTSNISILLLGAALVTGGLWQLQSLGKGFASFGLVQNHARGALNEVVAAQAALAQTDVKASEAAFIEAESLLQQTQAEFNTALASSKDILRYLDVTGTVRSGEELLLAAEALTQAGQHVSRAIAPFLEAQVMGEAETEHQGLVSAITSSQGDFEQAAQKLRAAEESLGRVSSPFLPEEIEGQVATLKTSVPRARELLEIFLKENNTLLHILGAERDRQYLILFANNHELRPVGGFIGTIGLVNVDRGRVENIDVQSVYDPDGQLREFIEPPLPLRLVTDRWYLRDANWFVDYEVSAQKIASFFEKEGGPTVDGVLLLTPDVIKRLLQVTGPIQVEGYDVEVTSENFVEVTQAEVTYDFDKELNRPKQFLADLTPVLLNRLFGTESSSVTGEPTNKLAVMAALGTALHHKEAVIYVRDEEVQQKIRDLRWAGGYPEDTLGFLSVNNANIGGHKSDQFIEQEIDYRVEVKQDGSADVVLTMRRSHRGPQEKPDYSYPEGEDPSVKANVVYQRVLVPKGALLKEAQGFTPFSNVPKWVVPGDEIQTRPDPDVAMWQASQTAHESGTVLGTEAGYAFFANWVVTQPGDTSVLMYRYELPAGYVKPLGFMDNAEQVSAYIAKQPGQIRTKVRTSILLPTEYRFVHTSPQDGVTRESPQEMVYRGDLQHDMLIGGVFEKAR